MDQKAQAIKNRLSLRKPQTDSLEILCKLVETLELSKNSNPAVELAKVRALHPTCTSFERDFPSICFSLATGVGKTRLMGAFIAYLFTAKGIKNFFVLAPNLTIYDKLIDDLSNPNSPKYVFKGIAEFTSAPPRIITGDNYSEARQLDYLHGSVNINIFNISKINSEVRGGREPRIKRLSEYLGESYFNYLSSLPDLVLLMDESHHYRADAGLRAINELKPILGLELTATPIDTRGEKFKNVVFDYPLALALQDGFVKEPAVATRRNFNPEQYRRDPKELDLIKLEDGIRIHEDTKSALDVYARNTGKPIVRPFILVVGQNTAHANELRDLIESERFFGGRYRDKVLIIHSNLRGEEREDNIQSLLKLEKLDNPFEIVVHVNMLKEGWDVTNLYTIIPLRASNAQILTEQTIGRGLRLPYGERTGDTKVDKLTIIAHDRFQSIIDAANDPHSIIRQQQIIEIDPNAYSDDVQEVMTAESSLAQEASEKWKEILAMEASEEKEKAVLEFDTRKSIVDAVNEMGADVGNINELTGKQAQELALKKIIEHIEGDPQQDLFKAQRIEAFKREWTETVEEIIGKTIPIPRIVIQQKNEVRGGFRDFNLETSGLNYQPVSEEIIIKTLRNEGVDYVRSDKEGVIRDIPANVLVNELMNYDDVDYDREAELLYKLAGQALTKLGEGRPEKELRNITIYYKRNIGDYIYAQMKPFFHLEQAEFEKPVIYPFTKIEPHNFSKYTKDSVHHFTETITPTQAIPTKVFSGFKKSCHNFYKFDSKAEKDFAAILEQDETALRWLRPAQAQFSIYWKYNSQRYTPDFVVETKDIICMIEIKAESDVDDADVQEKAATGKKYCEIVTEFNLNNNGKRWIYVLIPHTAVALNMSLGNLAGTGSENRQ